MSLWERTKTVAAKYTGTFFVVMLLNQLLFFGLCLNPICLVAAMPHVLLITVFIGSWINNESGWGDEEPKELVSDTPSETPSRRKPQTPPKKAEIARLRQVVALAEEEPENKPADNGELITRGDWDYTNEHIGGLDADGMPKPMGEPEFVVEQPETIDPYYFDTFQAAIAWAKNNPGEAITRKPDGNGFVKVKSLRKDTIPEPNENNRFYLASDSQQGLSRPIHIYFDSYKPTMMIGDRALPNPCTFLVTVDNPDFLPQGLTCRVRGVNHRVSPQGVTGDVIAHVAMVRYGDNGLIERVYVELLEDGRVLGQLVCGEEHEKLTDLSGVFFIPEDTVFLDGMGNPFYKQPTSDRKQKLFLEQEREQISRSQTNV